MELINVKVKSKGVLQTRDFQTKSGEQKKIKSLELVLTNGVDIVVGECTDDLAEDLSQRKLVTLWVSVQGVLYVSEWKTKDGQDVKTLRFRITRLNTI